METKRIVWLDILRVFSAFAIVSLHVSSYYLENIIPFGGVRWGVADLYLAFTRFAVPVFVMISGVFFLNPAKEIPLGKMYRKYIWRMLWVWGTWAALRTVTVNIWDGNAPVAAWGMDFFVSLQWYWFLPMIIGLYMIAPVLRLVTAANKKNILVYFMWLSVVLGTAFPVLEEVEKALFPSALPLSSFTNLLKLPGLIFGAHFVFGYYVCTYGLGPRAKKWLYAGGVASLLLMAVGTYVYFGTRPNPFYKYATYGASITPFAFLTGAAFFVWVKEHLEQVSFSARVVDGITRLARYSLGVYMCHLILLDFAMKYGWMKACSATPLAAILLWSVGLFIVSNGVVALLYKIPVFKKYCL